MSLTTHPLNITFAFRATLVCALVTVLYLATTETNIPVIDDLNDKLNHILAFGVLAFLADHSFPTYTARWMKLLVLFGFGIGIEVIQHFLPYREASLYDILANGLGLVLYGTARPFVRQLPFLRRIRF